MTDKIKAARECFIRGWLILDDLIFCDPDRTSDLEFLKSQESYKTILLALTALEKLDGVDLDQLRVANEYFKPRIMVDDWNKPSKCQHLNVLKEAANIVAEIKGGKENG